MRGIGSFYTVLCDADGQEYTLRAQKKLRHQKMTPMVGDRVRFTPGQGEEDGWLEEILPRKSSIVRPPVANVDMLMLVMASVPSSITVAPLNAVVAAVSTTSPAPRFTRRA